MYYSSTRGEAKSQPFLKVLLEGLAPDGGLYVPEKYPRFSAEELGKMRGMDYRGLAFAVLSKFIDDIPQDDLRKIINETYTKETFGSEEITPLKKLEPGFFILDLSEGPTFAFKDIALQLLGRLFEYALEKENRSINILGATSGDTGSAAETAMRERKGINVFMLSPYGRMSDFQRKQMYGIRDANIFNIAIKGTFDDCQDIVKELNADADFKKKYNLGAVNSINWARISAQVVYYFAAYFHSNVLENIRMEGQVSFAVPTGNFGNILAGYIARKMGLPIRRLILATNENNVLAEFFRTGIYRPRTGSEVVATSSPSMDISKASNFERYIFDLVERNPARIRELWKQLTEKGFVDVSGSEEFKRIGRTGIIAGSSMHKDRLATIKTIYEKYGMLIDPHTADGIKVGLEHRENGIPLICMETALPAKFAETIREATGLEPPYPANRPKLSELEEKFEVMEADPESVKKFIADHVTS